MQKPLLLPWAGLAIASCSAVLMMLAGVPFSYALAIWLVWSLSLWISHPPELSPETNAQPEGLSRESLAGMIENAYSPLLLVERKRVVIANASARALLGHHVIGQDVRVAIRHPSAIALMDSDKHGEAIITGLVRRKDVWRVSRYAIDDRSAVIELISKTAESDISRAHTDFVANASHELRTPLSSIIGYVETLSEHPEDIDEPTARKFLDTIHREARRLQNLVSDLMSLSRVEAEKHDRPDTKVDLNSLVKRAAHEGAGADRADRVEYRADGRFFVLGDPQQLEQLVRNLVDNAFKYGRAGTPVAVRLTESALGEAKLEVEDQGEGIEPEHLPHLTRRFYRTDPGRSRMSGGTGLGLAIVKHIVERHHGRLDIESAVGKGTTVTVRLPRESEEADLIEPDQAQSSRRSASEEEFDAEAGR
ncbi:sensor histidine kinase [Alteriqipengyuania lutimaris]|uniref:histidine kinase n=1 Tax=Alteriqipengyuania lutimaris TaxID=1538146 RepID=A0A395LMN6_9SPHN|nr:ATP-binding protein [Alteriqipengyuania lutimaris]MBB3033016.1 two-component system phosphate regulon sensor histidine kinase PhoR [Alteriqipengyuania lutimaris]RDS77909.1 two-component sensor histidine kinase [Alteriqipengyuania lutimaris]